MTTLTKSRRRTEASLANAPRGTMLRIEVGPTLRLTVLLEYVAGGAGPQMGWSGTLEGGGAIGEAIQVGGTVYANELNAVDAALDRCSMWLELGSHSERVAEAREAAIADLSRLCGELWTLDRTCVACGETYERAEQCACGGRTFTLQTMETDMATSTKRRSAKPAEKTFYCEEHQYNPPPNSGMAFCPQCEELPDSLEAIDDLANEPEEPIDETCEVQLPKSLKGKALVMLRHSGGSVYWGYAFESPTGGSSVPLQECAADRQQAVRDGLSAMGNAMRDHARATTGGTRQRWERMLEATMNLYEQYLGGRETNGQPVDAKRTRSRHSSAMPPENDPDATLEPVAPAARRRSEGGRVMGEVCAELAEAFEEAGRSIELEDWDESLISYAQSTPRVIDWPLDKISVHPVLRDVDPAHVDTLVGQFEADGEQRVPVELRIAPRRWSVGPDAIPEGHAQLLDGRHRCETLRRRGETHVRAILRADCDDVEALRIVARRDEGSKKWTDVERAKLLKAMHDAGQTWEACGAAIGLKSAQAAINLAAIADAPEAWQRRLVSGETVKTWQGMRDVPIHQATVREVARIAPVPGVLDALEQSLKKAGWQWDESDRDEQVELVRDIALEATRSLELADRKKLRDGYAISACTDVLFELTDEIREQLVPADVLGKPRATNVKLWDRLQEAAKKELIDSRAARKSKTAGKKGGDKSKAATAKLSPAQQRAEKQREAAEEKQRREKAAKETAERVKAWRLRATRYECARMLNPGDELVLTLLPTICAIAGKRRNAYCTDPVPLEDYLTAAAKIQCQRSEAKMAGNSTVARVRSVVNDPREDEITAGQELQCLLLQLLVWPQAEGRPKDLADLIADDAPPADWRQMTSAQRRKTRPVELLAIEELEVLSMAAQIGAAPGEVWYRAATSVSPIDRLLAEEFLDLHTIEQLDRLAEEVLPVHDAMSVRNSRTKSEKIATLLTGHKLAKPAKLPKCLQAAAGPKKKARR